MARGRFTKNASSLYRAVNASPMNYTGALAIREDTPCRERLM